MTYYDCDDYGSYTPYRCNGSADFEKDPDATIDFAFNLGGVLGSESITYATVASPDGLTVVSYSYSTEAVRVVVSGGTCGRTYRIVVTYLTDTGLVNDKTMRIRITEQ